MQQRNRGHEYLLRKREKMETEPKGRGRATHKEIINTILTLLYVSVLIVILRALKLGPAGVIIFLCALSLASMIYSSIRKKNPFRILSLLKNWGFIVALVLLIYHLTRWGILGFIGTIIAISVFILARRWKQFMAGLRRIETILYGKALDKKNWALGEFKNRPKRKLVWRKKNDNKQ